MLVHGQQLTVEQRTLRAVATIMDHPRYRYLAQLLMLGERRVTDNDPSTPTAKTDGLNEWYDRAFVDSLTDAKLRFLVLHENFHKMYKHLTTWAWMFKEDPENAAIACDYVINNKLVAENTDGFAVMPEQGLYDPQYNGMDAARIYHLLRQRAQPQPQQPEPGQHGQPERKPKQPKPPQPGAQPLPPRPGQELPGTGFDKHDWQAAQEIGDEQKKDIERQIDAAIRAGILIAGKTGGGVDRDIAEMMKPKIDWRDVLRDFLCDNFAGDDLSTWARPERRFIGMGAYLPSSYSETMGELVIAVDTSGSIGQTELSKFLGEVGGICSTIHPQKVRLLYWDTKVRRDETYERDEQENLAKSTKPAGGGGTDVECVTKYMSEFGITPQAVVVLTDGYLGGGWGNWTCPVLWGIVDNKSCRPPMGKYVHIND